MNTKEILVIGAGIAGCAVALAAAKRGVSVTMMTSPFEERMYHAPFIQRDKFEEKVCELQKEREARIGCSRAFEQLATLSRQAIDELLEPQCFVDRFGNMDIYRCLQEQLQQNSLVEWLPHYSVIELLTLDQHSHKKADRYKKPVCIGAIAFNHDTKRLEYFLAKETVLATGGGSSLYPYSTHPSTAVGGGIAIAYRAGARLLNMDQVQFHALGLFESDRPCFPLPLNLLAAGGKIYASKSSPIVDDKFPPCDLLRQFYDELLKTRKEHLWLDLTHLDHEDLKDKFPRVDAHCLNLGFNIIKDHLPVVPVAAYTCGGIVVHKTSQTSLLRLRAVGEVACTGLFWNAKEEALMTLESLTWALVCAEDIAKQSNKFIYYFPEIREGTAQLGSTSPLVEEDWKFLRQIMWSYVGIRHETARLERGCALLDQLSRLNTPHELIATSIDQIHFYHAIQTAKIIAHALLSNQGGFEHSFFRFPSLFSHRPREILPSIIH